MIVLDTHAWLWWASEPAKLGPRAREEIDRSERIGVATISAWELATLAQRGRVELDRPLEQWVAQSLSGPRVVAIELTIPIALGAGRLDRRTFPGDPVDRIIYATAQTAGARLATRDGTLRTFDPRATVWD